MTSWPEVMLGDLCLAKTGTVDPAKTPDSRFLYIDITSVDVSRKEVTEPRWLTGRDAPSRARRRVLEGDVIVSMTRPNLNAVALIGPEHSGQVCSTGFCVLRPGPRLDAGYLFHFVRTDKFVQPLTALVSGALYPAVSEGQVRQQTIPLPPLEEQRRIVDILERAASIRRLRREAQETARKIVPALFNKMFGDPDQNPMGWPVRLLGAVLCELPRNGLSPSRAGTYGDSVLTLSAITRGSFDATAVKEANFARPVAQRERVSSQDFLITRGNGNLELVGRGEFPTCDMPHVAFPDTIIAVRPKQHELSLEYLSAFWNTAYARRYLASKAQTTNGTFKLNQTAIVGIPVMLPPLEAQLAFAQLASATTRSNLLQSRAATLTQAATAAIEAHMFNG